MNGGSAANVANQAAGAQKAALDIIGDGIGVASNIFGVIGGPAAIVGLIDLIKGKDHAVEEQLNNLTGIVQNGFATVISVNLAITGQDT